MKSFKEILLTGHNKTNTHIILRAIREDNNRMEELMQLFCSKEKGICQRAAWPIGYMAEYVPQLIEPYFERMYNNLENPIHDAIVRNTLRTWHLLDIPEDYEGLVFDLCADYFRDTNTAVAIRMFSMVIITNIAMKYPDLKEEVIPLIEDYAPHGSTGLKARAKRELIRLRK